MNTKCKKTSITIICDVHDPFIFSAPPLTGPRKHNSLSSGFSDRLTRPQHLRYARAALAFGFITFFESCLCAYLFTGWRGFLEKQKRQAGSLKLEVRRVK